jgi:hypothetical protein
MPIARLQLLVSKHFARVGSSYVEAAEKFLDIMDCRAASTQYPCSQVIGWLPVALKGDHFADALEVRCAPSRLSKL